MKISAIILLSILALFVITACTNSYSPGASNQAPTNGQAAQDNQVNTQANSQPNTQNPVVQDNTTANQNTASDYTNIQSSTDDFNNIYDALSHIN